MRLVHLFDANIGFLSSAYIDETARVAYAYAQGDGAVAGTRITGAMQWSNTPWRRPDGVWNPDFRGVITTDDGAKIRFTFQGLSVPQPEKEARFTMVTSAIFQADAIQYRWLNNIVGVVEGELVVGETIRVTLRAYACVNELAAWHPPVPVQ